MLKSKTVFILGAGASKEVGFPIGLELKSVISNKLDLRFDFGDRQVGTGDVTIYTALRQQYQNRINDYLHACWQIRDGIILSDSIDDFIDAHQHDEKIAVCGKLAIARGILEAERNSKLFFKLNNVEDTIDFKSVDKTWYSKFYRLLTKQTTKAKLDSIFDNVTLINFNYDRSLEHFLVHALTVHYRIKIEEAQNLVQKLNIYRPYGSVGSYFGRIKPFVEFGFSGVRPVNEVTLNLKTYTEQVEEGDELKVIQQAIQSAEVLVFLGMAFHPNNMKLLHSEVRTKAKRIYATRKGISDHDLGVVTSQIDEMIGRAGIKRRNNSKPDDIFFAQECCDLFEEYQRTLASQ